MLEINMWHALPAEAVTLAVLVVIALVTAKPGERSFFIGIAVMVWGTIILTVFGIAWYSGWVVLRA
jgi:hypothetical protein